MDTEETSVRAQRSSKNLVSRYQKAVALDYQNFDLAGRSRKLSQTNPGALSGPAINGPVGDQSLSDLTAAPHFRWSLPGSTDFRFVLEGPYGVLTWDGAAGQLPFTAVGFTPVENAVYRWRVGGHDVDGVPGPWSPWVTFRLTGTVCGLSCVGYQWRQPDFCLSNPQGALTTVGGLVRYLNNLYACPSQTQSKSSIQGGDP